MDCKVAVIGGYGGMGRIFSELFKSHGCEVTICGPTVSKGEKAALEFGVKYSKNNVETAAKSDIVVITVPIQYTEQTIMEVAPHVKSGALLMDLTSVKSWPCELMDKYAKAGVEVLGTHPVFGPRVGKLDGQVMVLTPIRGEYWLKWFREILIKNNAKIVDSNPKEHDEVMAVVQGLTHFAYISVGKTLYDLNIDVKRTRDFSSPIYDLMLDMVGRIIGQDPHLYAEIQITNPQVQKIHEHYLNAAKELSEAVRNKDEEQFVKYMVAASKHFDDTERAMGRSDKAIGSLVAELKKLKKSIGKPILLKHIYSKKLHAGIVESVTADEVKLSDNKTLKLSNLRILDEQKLKEYNVKKYGTIKRDFSYVHPEQTDENFISHLVETNIADIVSVTVKEVFRGEKIGKEQKSVCYAIEFISYDIQNSDAQIKDFFAKLGSIQR